MTLCNRPFASQESNCVRLLWPDELYQTRLVTSPSPENVFSTRSAALLVKRVGRRSGVKSAPIHRIDDQLVAARNQFQLRAPVCSMVISGIGLPLTSAVTVAVPWCFRTPDVGPRNWFRRRREERIRSAIPGDGRWLRRFADTGQHPGATSAATVIRCRCLST